MAYKVTTNSEDPKHYISKSFPLFSLALSAFQYVATSNETLSYEIMSLQIAFRAVTLTAKYTHALF